MQCVGRCVRRDQILHGKPRLEHQQVQEEFQVREIQAAIVHLMIQDCQDLMVVHTGHQVYHFNQDDSGGDPPDDGGDGGDSGGDSEADDGDEPPDTDQACKHPRYPPDDPDSSGDGGGRGRRRRHQTPLTINKWAKPLPKLDLPPRIHLQKASKVKQIWELWSVSVALAMSTWNDVAVTYWHQVYIQSEESYQHWRRSGMADRFAYEKKRTYMGARHPSQPLVLQWNSDNIFMTEGVAIFRESGLRDDVTIASLQDACLKLVLLARARARELQVDQQVERAQQPLSAKTATILTTKSKPMGPPETDKPVCRFFLKPDRCENGDNCQYAHPRTNGKCLRCGSESHNLQACTRPRRQQSSRSNSVKPAPKKTYAKSKGRAADAQESNQGNQEKKKSKGKSKGKGNQKATTKSGDVDFDDNSQADQDEPDEQRERDEHQENDPEAYVIAARTSSSESDMESDGMLDWSASECKDYKVGIATVACASPDSLKTHKDTWEWRGPCCLVRAHRQLRKCLFTPTWKEDLWHGLTVQPQRITHVKPQDQSF